MFQMQHILHLYAYMCLNLCVYWVTVCLYILLKAVVKILKNYYLNPAHDPSMDDFYRTDVFCLLKLIYDCEILEDHSDAERTHW